MPSVILVCVFKPTFLCIKFLPEISGCSNTQNTPLVRPGQSVLGIARNVAACSDYSHAWPVSTFQTCILNSY